MKRGAILLVILTCFFLTFAVVLAQAPFTLGQSGVGISGTSSGGGYSVHDALGEPDTGIASGGAYQVSSGLVLGGSGPTATFALAITKNGEGTVILDPPGGVYAAGTVVQLTAAPPTGFTFAGWSGAVSSAANPITVTMDGDKTVTVTFTQVTSSGAHIYLPMLKR